MKKIILFMILFSLFAFPSTCFAATKVNVPVILYHVVSANPNGQYQFSLAEFKKDMDYLKANGYTTLSIDEYYKIINKTSTMTSKAVLLTFDDCTSDFYTNVYPILKQYGMKATQFAVSNWIDRNGYMTSSQLKTVAANGIDVQNHTIDHKNLTTLTHNQKYSAINDATAKIKSITGKVPLYCAYPYGGYDADTISILKGLGYRGSFKVGGGLSTEINDKYELPRIMMINGDSLTVFARKLTTGQ